MKSICTIALIVIGALIGSQAHAQTLNLGNTKWGGSETLANFGKLEFQFQSGGKVTMHDAKETSYGEWRLDQNKVMLTFYKGQVQYVGNINGNQINGTATNGQANWNWTVSNLTPAA